jgi:hypothetical protein
MWDCEYAKWTQTDQSGLWGPQKKEDFGLSSYTGHYLKKANTDRCVPHRDQHHLEPALGGWGAQWKWRRAPSLRLLLTAYGV